MPTSIILIFSILFANHADESLFFADKSNDEFQVKITYCEYSSQEIPVSQEAIKEVAFWVIDLSKNNPNIYLKHPLLFTIHTKCNSQKCESGLRAINRILNFRTLRI